MRAEGDLPRPPGARSWRGAVAGPMLSALVHAAAVAAVMVLGEIVVRQPPALLVAELALVLAPAEAVPVSSTEPVAETPVPAPTPTPAPPVPSPPSPSVAPPRKPSPRPLPVAAPARIALPRAADEDGATVATGPAPADAATPAEAPAAAPPRAPAVASSGVQVALGSAEMPAPPYPSSARRRGRQGTVMVRIEVSADGRPDRVEIVESSGDAALDDAAAATLGRWRLRPATENGRPVPGSVLVPVVFRLQ